MKNLRRPLTCAFALVALFVLPLVAADPVSIVHFAGSQQGIGITDGTGSSARFAEPTSIVSDAAGNLYVSDPRLHTIRKVTPSGAVTTLAGVAGESGSTNGRGGAARFAAPGDLAFDLNGNLLVADSSRIRRITPQGAVTTFVDGVAILSIAVDSFGNVYYGSADNKVHKLSPSGQALSSYAHTALVMGLAFDANGVLTALDNSGAIRRLTGAGTFSPFAVVPAGVAIAFGPDGMLYVSTHTNQIMKITPAGSVSVHAGTGFQGSEDGPAGTATFTLPSGVAVTPNGDVYIADTHNYIIRKISSGVVSTVAGTDTQCSNASGDLTTARFGLNEDVVGDANGNVYVAQTRHIRKISAGGVVSDFVGSSTQGGSVDSSGTNARFQEIEAIAINASGNLFVSDRGAHTIRKVTPLGIVTTYAGLAGQSGSTNGVATEARFSYPRGLVVDASDNVYVADSANHTIRKITPSRTVTTLAGTAGVTGTNDAVGSAARFNYPVSLAIDDSGLLYVADYFNHTIRRIDPANGSVSTLAGQAGALGWADGTGSAARLHSPFEMQFFDGMVYFIDGSVMIRTMTATGEVSTVAGRRDIRGNVDGTGSNALVNPAALGSGNNTLYLAQWEHCNVRKIRAPGIADVAIASTPTPALHTAVQLGTDPQNATSWQWSIVRRPPGSTAQISAPTSRTPTFTPDVPDTFTLLLRAESAAGVRFSTLDITPVDPCPPLASVIASISGTATVCETTTGGTASVVVEGGGTVTYQWGWRLTPDGATQTIAGATSSSYVVNGADLGGSGARYVVATVTSSCGGSLVSNPIAVTVLALPDATINASSGVYAGETYNFASVPDAGPGATYSWSISNGTITEGAGTRTIRYTAGASGSVMLSVTVTKSGCHRTGNASVAILGSRPANATMLYLLSPCRVLDTRGGDPIQVNMTVEVVGLCGVPWDAQAVAVNITAVSPATSGFLAFWPVNEIWPGTSTLNYRPGRSRANNAVLRVAGQALRVYNTGAPVHFLIDVTGYFK